LLYFVVKSFYHITGETRLSEADSEKFKSAVSELIARGDRNQPDTSGREMHIIVYIWLSH